MVAFEERPEAPRRDDLGQAIDRVREAAGAVSGGWYREPQQAWKTHFVREGGVADRDELRQYIEKMTAPVAAKRLLLLRDPSLSGKSFSRHLLWRVACRRGEPMAYVDLSFWDDEEEGSGADAFDVARNIATQLSPIRKSQPRRRQPSETNHAESGSAWPIQERIPDQPTDPGCVRRNPWISLADLCPIT